MKRNHKISLKTMNDLNSYRFGKGLAFGLAASAALLTGCISVGPDYERPEVEIAESYKAASVGDWKEGEPLDHLPKGRWWEVFEDAELNSLQEQALLSNQELAATFAALNQARAQARMARSEFFPGVEANPGFRRERFSPNQEPDFGALTANTFATPVDLSYEVDLWGRVRRGFESARAEAAAAEATFQNVLLSLQADLAENYFSLRALDGEAAVLRRTIELRDEQVEIVRSRFEIGLGAELDVARAEAELASSEADLSEVFQRRAALENAVALLVGESPSTFEIDAREGLSSMAFQDPPIVPAGLPSELLERRPDVAEAERRLAADNARIGVAKAAFFPVLRLTGSGGYVSAEVDDLFEWESRVWSIGPSLSLPIFTGGRNMAALRRSEARYEESVARYRQQVLVAFGDVENALSSIHHLGEQSAARERALVSAIRARDLASESFDIGLTDYISVIDADRVALQNQRSSVQVAGQRMVAAVRLVRALGGGWIGANHASAE